MDIKQEEITTLHDLHINNKRLMKIISDASVERPVSLIIPMLYNEIKGESLTNIIKQLNKCTYLNEVIIALSAKNKIEFEHAKKFFSKLTLKKYVMWCNSPEIEDLLLHLRNQGLNITKYGGKGKDVWLAIGIASIHSYAIALHDADIQNYSSIIPTRLIYPILEPELDFKFNKGYYARTSIDKNIMYGRVFRLFLHPLLRVLIDQLNHEPNFVRFLRALRYPLSGEFALTSDLAQDLDTPPGWGIEIVVMAEIYRNAAIKRICQTDLGFYDHKHQGVGDSTKGLVRMSAEIFKSLLRVLIEEDHIQVSKPFLLSLRVLYQKHAKDCIRKYNADARINGIKYDRHMEETMVEKFSQELMSTGTKYMTKPVGTRLPDWLRTISARAKIREEILNIVMEQNK